MSSMFSSLPYMIYWWKFFYLLPLLQQIVNQSKLSGDFDTAEGGFDALMQLAACDEVSFLIHGF